MQKLSPWSYPDAAAAAAARAAADAASAASAAAFVFTTVFKVVATVGGSGVGGSPPRLSFPNRLPRILRAPHLVPSEAHGKADRTPDVQCVSKRTTFQINVAFIILIRQIRRR